MYTSNSFNGIIEAEFYSGRGRYWIVISLTHWGRGKINAISRCIFLNENLWVPIKISLTFVPKGPINNISALVQIMTCRRPGDKHYLNQWWLVHRRIYASLGLNELMLKVITVYFSAMISISIHDIIALITRRSILLQITGKIRVNCGCFQSLCNGLTKPFNHSWRDHMYLIKVIHTRLVFQNTYIYLQILVPKVLLCNKRLPMPLLRLPTTVVMVRCDRILWI